MYEEIELLTSMFTQLFEHADLWAEEDLLTYTNIKDCMLFAVPHLVSNFHQAKLRPSSATEDHLNQIIHDNKSALSLKAQINLINTVLSCASCLHNVLSI